MPQVFYVLNFCLILLICGKFSDSSFAKFVFLQYLDVLILFFKFSES